jgi:hypothetical protein
MYDKVRDGIIEQTKGNILNEKECYIGKTLCREIVTEHGGYIVNNRYFLSGDKFFQIKTTVEKQTNRGFNVQEFGKKFLNSFQFIK